MNHNNDNQLPIDFVVTWVDDTDPKWKESKNKYLKCDNHSNDARNLRYRDWGFFVFWFRAVEKYAPWVRRIFLVTNGQIPSWLNIHNSKIRIVNHSEIMDSEDLPTFNSAAIEVNLYKIHGLSEKFVYFNDDMFLTAPVKPSDFFVKGKPVDRGIENVIPLVSDEEFYVVNSIMRNSTMVINRHFSKREFLKKNFTKWYSLRLGSEIIRNILLTPWREFCGFYTYHMPTPFLRKTFTELYEIEYKLLKSVSGHRFRSNDDVSQWLFQYWQIASGQYVLPRRNETHCFSLTYRDEYRICEAIRNKRYKIICVNDVDSRVESDEKLGKSIIDAFLSVHENKSEYEL